MRTDISLEQAINWWQAASSSDHIEFLIKTDTGTQTETLVAGFPVKVKQHACLRLKTRFGLDKKPEELVQMVSKSEEITGADAMILTERVCWNRRPYQKGLLRFFRDRTSGAIFLCIQNFVKTGFTGKITILTVLTRKGADL